MDDKLSTALESIGADGIQAFYVYLAVEYISIWVLVGLLAWGARAVWKKMKDDLSM